MKWLALGTLILLLGMGVGKFFKRKNKRELRP